MFESEESNISAESELSRKKDFLGFLGGSKRTSLYSSENLWLVSYSDFMTILMIFFLVLYGYSYLVKSNLDKLKKENISYSQFSEDIEKMKSNFGNELQIKNESEKVVVQLNEKILFGSGKAILDPEAFSALEQLSNLIKLVEGDVVVQGHTDNIPVVGGRFGSNWELSAARSFSVVEALTKSGIPHERLSAWGMGENYPIVPNDSAINRATNRRIEIIILKKDNKEA
ncbi:MAG: flagellar motor protein MotB [Elusimicrobiota bacterium]